MIVPMVVILKLLSCLFRLLLWTLLGLCGFGNDWGEIGAMCGGSVKPKRNHDLSHTHTHTHVHNKLIRHARLLFEGVIGARKLVSMSPGCQTSMPLGCHPHPQLRCSHHCFSVVWIKSIKNARVASRRCVGSDAEKSTVNP